MIKTREQFEERLRKLRDYIKEHNTGLYREGYVDAIKTVLEVIEDEGGCFRE